MTIHSEWAKLFYHECPQAFSESVKSTKLDVGIIDGHLQLMCLNEFLVTWDRFIQSMFLRPIEQMFKMGCKTVVVCFDAYEHVPVFKNMTQHKRSQGREVCTFDPQQDLPKHIPHDTMKYLMNRVFKLKVIQLLCEKLPSLVQLSEGQEFIIDYKTVVHYSPGNGMIPKLMSEFKPMGESDVKFTRYVQKYGNALVHAIDGDYMVIALLYYSNVGVHEKNKMFLYRQCQKSYDTLVGESKSTKRKLERSDEFDEESESKQKKDKKKKCWVDMQLIFVSIIEAFRQSVVHESKVVSRFFPSQAEDSEQRDFIRAAVFLILCAGTDFSRQLPLIGPQRLWDLLPQVGKYLIDATKSSNVDSMLNVFVSKVYKTVFYKHIQSKGSTWSAIYESLQKSALSASTKNRIPDESQLLTTIKNVMWVIQYWDTVNDKVSTPLDGSCGFLLCRSSGKVIFEDLLKCQ